MCSWCWGFAPVFGTLTEALTDRLPVTVMLGGLRPGTTIPQDAAEKAARRQHWQNVARASGQPFDFSFFDRPDFVYDTEPAARAVVVARRFGSAWAHRVLTAVQAAFYRDNRDVTNEDVLTDIAATCGLARTAFSEALLSDAAYAETREDFARVRDLAIGGFPTVLGQDRRELTVLVAGYRPWNTVRPVIERWMLSGD